MQGTDLSDASQTWLNDVARLMRTAAQTLGGNQPKPWPKKSRPSDQTLLAGEAEIQEALITGPISPAPIPGVCAALAALFKGAIGKDAVSRIWRKVKTDWEAWSKRPLGEEDVVRLIVDGTVVRVRLDKKATSISLLVVLGVRRDGRKVLLAVKNMGGESTAARRALLDDLVARGLTTPEFLIIDGAAGLEKALAAL